MSRRNEAPHFKVHFFGYKKSHQCWISTTTAPGETVTVMPFGTYTLDNPPAPKKAEKDVTKSPKAANPKAMLEAQLYQEVSQ